MLTADLNAGAGPGVSQRDEKRGKETRAARSLAFCRWKAARRSRIKPAGTVLFRRLRSGLSLAAATPTGLARMLPHLHKTNERLIMKNAYADDCHIETRFVWARCAAENAQSMRNLIRDFQNDGWTTTRNAVAAKKMVRRKKSAKPSGASKLQHFLRVVCGAKSLSTLK